MKRERQVIHHILLRQRMDMVASNPPQTTWLMTTPPVPLYYNRMRNWKLEKFDGTLLDIIEDCVAFLPTAWHLANTQRWLIGQIEAATDNPDILLPVRRLKDHPERGSVFTRDGIRFMPVDNEPANALFEYVRLNGSKPLESSTLKQLLDKGRLPASWSSDVDPPANPQWKFQQADDEFRSLGLKLTHIFDPSHKTLNCETVDTCIPRFFRTMNPVNWFPFPGVKQVTFDGDLKGDIAENPVVRHILRGFMMEYLAADAEAVEDWIHYSDINLTEQQLKKQWRLEAKSIQLTVVHKRDEAAEKKRAVAGADLEDFADTAAPKTEGGAKGAVSLKQAADLLAGWVDCNRGESIRMDGKPYVAEGNRTAWILFRVQHFSGEDQMWNGTYRFHGDTTIDSIRELLGFDEWVEGGRPPLDTIAEAVKANLQPAWTRSKNRSLVLKGHSKPDGFYCFQL